MPNFGLATNQMPSVKGAYGETLLSKTAPALIGGSLTQRRALTIQNNGPNPIVLGFTDAVTVATGLKISAGGSWSIEADEALQVWGLATTADQLTGAATNWAEIGDK